MKSTRVNVSITFILSTLVFVNFVRCKGGDKKFYKEDLQGLYSVETVVPRHDSVLIDPHLFDGSLRVYLKLEEHDNFEFRAYEKKVVGYWAFDTKDPSEPKLLFQSGYMPEDVIYARFNKSQVYFDRPLWLFDSLYTEVIFKRVEK